MLGQSENANHRLIQRCRVLRGMIRSGAVVTTSHVEHLKRIALAAGADPQLVKSLGLAEPTDAAERAAEAAMLLRFGWGTEQ